MRAQDTARLIGLALLWSFSFCLSVRPWHPFGAVGVVLLRVGIAAIFLHGYALITKQDLALRTHWRHYILLGLFQTAVPFLLFALALKDIGASLGSIINATSPLFGLIIAIAIGDESPAGNGLWALPSVLLGWAPWLVSTTTTLQHICLRLC